MSLAVVGPAAFLQCSAGSLKTPFLVLGRTVMAEMMFMGNITDNKPLINILPFGTCDILAAAGDPACSPATVMPWISMAINVLVEGRPALDKSSCLFCSVGGMITVVEPGNVTVMVP